MCLNLNDLEQERLLCGISCGHVWRFWGLKQPQSVEPGVHCQVIMGGSVPKDNVKFTVSYRITPFALPYQSPGIVRF